MKKITALKTLLIRSIILLTCYSSSFAFSASPDTNTSKQDFFHVFSNSLKKELELSQQENKLGLMLFFGTQHCPFCLRMKRTVFTRPLVQQYFRRHFQVLDIDIESELNLIDEKGLQISYIDYARSHNIRLTPTIVFVDHRGRFVYRQAGMIADPQELIWLGEYVINGHTNKQSFATYKMQKRRVANP